MGNMEKIYRFCTKHGLSTRGLRKEFEERFKLLDTVNKAAFPTARFDIDINSGKDRLCVVIYLKSKNNAYLISKIEKQEYI